MKTIYIILAILILAIITNPNIENHQKAVYNKLYFTYQQQEDVPKKKLTDFEEGIKGISDIIVQKALKIEVEQIINTDNCLLFSFTKFENKNGSRIIGIGAFGHVHIFPEIIEFWKDTLKKNK